MIIFAGISSLCSPVHTGTSLILGTALRQWYLMGSQALCTGWDHININYSGRTLRSHYSGALGSDLRPFTNTAPCHRISDTAAFSYSLYLMKIGLQQIASQTFESDQSTWMKILPPNAFKIVNNITSRFHHVIPDGRCGGNGEIKLNLKSSED